MVFDYDPEKDEANRAKHGVSLLFGRQIFDDPEMTLIPTIREGDEEDRFKAIGVVEGKLFTAIHIWRDGIVRLISVRRSNGNEQRNYDCNSSGSE